MARIEDEWYAEFHEMAEVPFADSLRERILQKARNQSVDFIEARQPNRRLKKRMVSSWRPWLAAASGLCIMAAMGWGVVSFKPASSSTHLETTVRPSISAATVTKSAVEVRRNVPFGLMNAPLSLSPPSISSEPGYAKGSFVNTQILNLGTSTIHEGQVFGILWFTKPKTDGKLASSDWATFVNFQLANGSKSLAPGKQATWSFRPVTAPITPDGHLVDVPHLAFFQSGLVNPSQADVVWQQSKLLVSAVKVVQGEHVTNGQSVHVSAVVRNPTHKPISMRPLLAIVWFSPKPSKDWTKAQVVRFLDTPYSLSKNTYTISPGESESVSYHVIGSQTTDFLGLVPHVALVKP